MSRKKGKAQRRSKDWGQRYDAGEEVEDVASAPQKFSLRGIKVPPWRQAAEENLEGLPRQEGMVVGLFPGGVLVRAGQAELLCGVAKMYRPPEGASALAVGDLVTLALTRHADASHADKDRADAMIVARQLRRTVLCRPAPQSGKRRGEHAEELQAKVIAVNMDVLLIVCATCQPAFRQNLVDRFAIVAERGELKPVLVINKIDLAAPDERALEDCRSMGLVTLCCSAATGAGLDELRSALAGRRVVMAGASGVGKSTLVNALVPGAQAPTREIRMRDQRGRHTTSSAVVYDLPECGILVDTPGVRELGMGMNAGELSWYYPEFEPLSGQCKFRDCRHTHEPNCAVRQAAQDGRIPARRYQSYLRILETMEE